MQKILQLHLTDLDNCAKLGLYSNKQATNKAIDLICEANKSHRFTIDELREILADYVHLSLGLELLIATNFR